MADAPLPTGSVEIREIVRLPGYGFGSDGSAWTRMSRNGKGGFKDTWRQLSPVLHYTGYRQIHLHVDRKSVNYRLHQLILEAFVGPCPVDMECRHLDGDKSNNAIANLMWGTPSENYADRVRHGSGNEGERNHFTRLTANQVEEIRALDKTDRLFFRRTAERYGISDGYVRDIRNGRCWKHLLRDAS